MKRAMGGGAHRGPVAPSRQRRTLRFVQVLMVVIAAGLFAFAGYAYGRVDGYEAGRRAGEFDAPRPPSVVQALVLVALGGVALGTAALLQDGGAIRVPTPARLEELADRAERTAIQKAEQIAEDSRSGSV